jgi:histidinol dehydrogenase
VSTKSSADLKIRFRGKLLSLSAADERLLFDRSSARDEAIAATVSGIIDRVRSEGDAALIDLARRFDRVELEAIEVPRDRVARALAALDPSVRRAMEHAAENIERVHRAFLPQSGTVEVEPGISVTRRPDPLGRVGVYAPGGTAAYPSSVLMGAIPARIAGVGDVILCSPPGNDGIPSNVVLAAAELAGVNRVFAVGGAGAIAAMALGTRTILRVDKIVGPGNAYVAEAKLQLGTNVAFDSPAGPSELAVIADSSADPQVIAREVLAQAEHDPRAIVVVFAEGKDTADRIEKEIVATIGSTPRREIIFEALATRGGVVWVTDIAEAIEASNRFAPEHLMLATKDPARILDRIRNAGTVFVGLTSSVSFGDYITGANHVLPTGGLARSYSGLSTLDFFRWTTCQTVSARGADTLARDTAVFAESEGLYAHAAAARAWEKP